MDEFGLIRRYFKTLAPGGADVLLGIGDDCALLSPPAGHVLAVTSDTLVADRHFYRTAPAAGIGHKALAVNLSDLAAMGAQPRWFTLALTLPSVNEPWLADFAVGMARLAQESQIALVGGDTTRGPLSITITAMGSVPKSSALTRSGAQVGDWVCVTGSLGDAALALQLLQQATAPVPSYLLQRLEQPTPRISSGLALRGLASAAIDVSDGLAGDLTHLLQASGVGAELFAPHLPASEAFLASTTAYTPEARWALQARGGDDYELCLTIAPQHFAQSHAQLTALGVPLTAIGQITARPGLWQLHADGALQAIHGGGYVHF